MPKFWQNEFFGEKNGLCQFLNIAIIYHRPKNRKSKRPIPEENTEQTVWQKLDISNSPSLPLIAPIELVSESLWIFNPGIFDTFFPLMKAVREDVETHAAFFPKSDQEILTGVWTLRIFNLWYWHGLNARTSYEGCIHSTKITYLNCFLRGLNWKILHGLFSGIVRKSLLRGFISIKSDKLEFQFFLKGN